MKLLVLQLGQGQEPFSSIYHLGDAGECGAPAPRYHVGCGAAGE